MVWDKKNTFLLISLLFQPRNALFYILESQKNNIYLAFFIGKVLKYFSSAILWYLEIAASYFKQCFLTVVEF